MKRSSEITSLANSIMLDITDKKLPLHLVALKASRLTRLLDDPEWTKWFVESAKLAEIEEFMVGSFECSMDAAKDREVSVSSANPTQHVFTPMGNVFERSAVKKDAEQSIAHLSEVRSAVYIYASSVYAKWQFGNVAESIFEKRRSATDQALKNIFPDANERLNSIEQNLQNDSPEDWKNAINSCRTLLMDLADVLNPAKTPEEKGKYLNRLKDFISPKIDSESVRSLHVSYLEELKNILEQVIKSTQGGAHQERHSKNIAETIVLHTYLIVANLMEIHALSGDRSAAKKIEPPQPER